MGLLDTLYGTTQYSPYTIDPGLIAQQQALATQATDFNTSLPSYQQQQYTQADNASRSQMANQMQGNKYGANSRGLLYSGLKQGADAGTQAQGAANMSNQVAQINQGAQNQANQLTSGAANAGLQVQNATNQVNFGNYQNQLSNWTAQQNAIRGTINGIGGLIGAAAGAGI